MRCTMNETPGSQLRELTPLNKKDNLRRQSVASDCIKVEYFVFGSGRETLLMIPGLGRWAHDLDGIANAIAAAGFRVVTINHRGIGGSEGPRNELSRLCLGVLRTAAGELLRTDDIAVRVIATKGFDVGDAILRAAIREQVGSTVKRLHRKGAIENIGAGRASKWKLKS
jgi:alpha-beta hydrolase superfamily lysophospholipase